MNCLVLDIETVSDTDFGRRLYGLEGPPNGAVGKMLRESRQPHFTKFLDAWGAAA